MVDLAAVRAEIARQREIEAKASPNWKAEGATDLQGWETGKVHILMSHAPQPCAYDFDREEDAEEAALARNAHRSLLDVAAISARVVESMEAGDVAHIDELEDALKRITGGERG